MTTETTTRIDREKMTTREQAAWGAAFEHALAMRCELAVPPDSHRHAAQFGRALTMTFAEPDAVDAKVAGAWADEVVAAMRLADLAKLDASSSTE